MRKGSIEIVVMQTPAPGSRFRALEEERNKETKKEKKEREKL
jgi:hypothetical protein